MPLALIKDRRLLMRRAELKTREIDTVIGKNRQPVLVPIVYCGKEEQICGEEESREQDRKLSGNRHNGAIRS